MSESARRLLDILWKRYEAEVPYARTFVELAGGRFQNDHVAFRSLARPGDGIGLLAPVFERLGWKRAGVYAFPSDHLEAIHLSHPDGLPRIFLSEIRLADLSPAARKILGRIPAPPPAPEDIDALADWFGPPTTPITERDLMVLEGGSQYAAWLLAFGRKVNHFTASVDDVEVWSRRLRQAGVPMKDEIEGEPGGPLRQTATHAVRLPLALNGTATVPWPYAYLEIAQRRPDFDGFLAPQARNLFEMTRR
jgi:hypothetical protein